MPDILHRIEINAAPADVYAALTEQQGLSGWWTHDVQANSVVGAILKFRFGDKGGNDMKVLELIPGKRVHWQCVDGGSEWIGTEVVFDLREKAGAAIVLFSQRGWKEQTEFMHYCSTKWATYLLSLKALLEDGNGFPYPDDIGIDV